MLSKLYALGHNIHLYGSKLELYKCRNCGGIFNNSSYSGHINYKSGNKWKPYEDIECKDFLIKEIIE